MINTGALRSKCETAFEFAGKQLRHLITTYPGFFPMYTVQGQVEARRRELDQLVRRLPGRAALAAAPAHRRRWWRAQAEHYSRLIEHRKTDRNVHDLGFCSGPPGNAGTT